jgi:hypothetical protein
VHRGEEAGVHVVLEGPRSTKPSPLQFFTFFKTAKAIKKENRLRLMWK